MLGYLGHRPASDRVEDNQLSGEFPASIQDPEEEKSSCQRSGVKPNHARTRVDYYVYLVRKMTIGLTLGRNHRFEKKTARKQSRS